MRRLLHFDEAPPLETPLILLGELREIDPTIELVHFGLATELPDRLYGKVLQDWRLASVRPTEQREHMGHQILEMESRRGAKNMKNILLGRLALQGFAQIARYFSEGTPGLSPTFDDAEGLPINIVEDLQFRDQQWRLDQGEDVFKTRLDISEGIPQSVEANRILLDKLHTDGRDAYRRPKRGALITNIYGD